MLRRVKIKVVPKARTGYQVRGALANDVPAFGGADYNAYIGQPDTKVSKTILCNRILFLDRDLCFFF